MPAREICKFDYDSFEKTAYHPSVAAKIIGLAFLSAVAAWEDFISHIYLGYLWATHRLMDQVQNYAQENAKTRAMRCYWPQENPTIVMQREECAGGI